MTILVAIDDTDVIGSRGTGRLARAIADALSDEYPVSGVTRHQLFVHDAIPFTSHNSCAVIHVDSQENHAADDIFERAEEVMLGDFIEGSDPGIAVATGAQLVPALIAYGKDAKTTILTQDMARNLAKNCSIRLKGLGGTEDGVIGAMAGLGLAATGTDGRFLQKGRIREILGPCTAADLFAAGVDAITTLDGRPVVSGRIMVEENKAVKPCPVSGRTVLFVEERDGTFYAVKRD